MTRDHGLSLQYQTLINLLLPPVAGMLSVLILLSFLYWKALRILLDVADVTLLEMLGGVRFYAGFIALALIVTALTVVLAGIRTLRYFDSPLRRLDELERNRDLLPPGRFNRAKTWLYYQLRNRLLLIILAGMGGVFFLLGGLYLFVLTSFARALPAVTDGLYVQLGELRYYAPLVFFALVLSAILIVLVSIKQLKELLNLREPDLARVDSWLGSRAELKEIEAEFEKLLFSLRTEELEGEG